MRNHSRLIALGVLSVLLIPGISLAQTTQPNELRTPRNNTRAGAVVARAPGTWVQAGVAQYEEFHARSLAGGGATYTGAPDDPRTVFLVNFLPAVFDFAEALVLAIGAGILDPGNGTGSLRPALAQDGVQWGIDRISYQVLVEFREAVDEATAETASNYSIGTVTATSATLDTTGRLVVVTFTNATFPGDSSLTVALQNIRNRSGLPGTGPVTVQILDNLNDTVAPSVSSVESVTGSTQIRVMFNEALDRTSAETVTNYLSLPLNANPTSAVLQVDARTVLLTFNQAVPAGNLRVSVQNSIQDLNLNAARQVDVPVQQVTTQPSD